VNQSHFDVIVLGAGAAGMMCALTAGQYGRSVALLEHNERAGQKIAISGGGRCNFTNLKAGPENYLSANPGFFRSALARYRPTDFIALIEKHRIAYHEKKLGQQFCNTSSREIIDMLLTECRAARVDIRCGCPIRQVEKSDRFTVQTSQGTFTSESLVVATGGLSFPKLGATDLGYRIARQFGLRVTEVHPGLVPLTGTPEFLKDFASLSGLSLPVRARTGKTSFDEALLFTHRGFSGPVVLQISSYRKHDTAVTVDLLPELGGDAWCEADRHSRLTPLQLLSRHWPNRFAETWCQHFTASKPLQHYKNTELAALTQLLHQWPLPVSGTEGYAKAEVTLGGVDTKELSSKTMEAHQVRGLFFIGEVVDVTGWLGGYNFQWAWASAHAAGLALAETTP
jgi:predicted Rossmann fold flavoprotein